MHLGSTYLIVNDFEKSIEFYEKLLGMPVTSRNMHRFAQFIFEGTNISIMNGHFDTDNPDKVVHKGGYN
jgi:lactoylglutathione lyase